MQKLETDKNQNRIGVLSLSNFLKEHRNENFYLYEYFKPDGVIIEKDEPICKIQIGESKDNTFSSITIYAQTSGILEWTVEQKCQLFENTVYYRLHEKGVYNNENSIDSDEYIHYYLSYNYNKNIWGGIVAICHRFDKWLVSDGSYVKCGDEIYTCKDSDFKVLTQKAEKDGFIDIVADNMIYGLSANKLLYYIRIDDSKRINRKYINIPIINIDDFTQKKNIIWEKVSTKDKAGNYIKSKSDDGLIELAFTFNFLQGEDKIIFNFNPKQVSPKRNDKISFLFQSGDMIEYSLNSNPVSIKNIINERVLEYKTTITNPELDLFAKNKLKKWKISLLNENREIIGGEKGSYTEYQSKYNLNIVIQKFAADYKLIVLSSIIDYQPVERNEIFTEISDDTCHVYLMHDTSNNFYKIGISNKPNYREKTLQSEKPTIELIVSKQFPIRKIAESIEKSLHSVYDKKRLRGEWFELNEIDVKNIIESLK